MLHLLNESSMCIDLQVLNYEEIYMRGIQKHKTLSLQYRTEMIVKMKMLASNVLLYMREVSNPWNM